LFFDEADDLFKEGSYLSRMLLIQIEKARCVVIFATNKGGQIDPAMERRISMKFHFPLPDTEQRLKIWQALLPDFVRLAPEVDLNSLNNRYPSAGALSKIQSFWQQIQPNPIVKATILLLGNYWNRRQMHKRNRWMENDKFCTTYSPIKTCFQAI